MDAKIMTTIAIIDAPEASAVISMFLSHNYASFLVSSLEELNTHSYDIVCFVGGEDLTPALYKEQYYHPLTHNNLDRDIREKTIYESIPKYKPKVGICRGGQFLNVMNDGSMLQHIEGHRNTLHKTYIHESADYSLLNSDHHQAMLPAQSIIEASIGGII